MFNIHTSNILYMLNFIITDVIIITVVVDVVVVVVVVVTNNLPDNIYNI